MTREEERIEQIEKFAYERYECYEDYSAFVLGAIWADKNKKNVWHDASEEPQGYNYEILCVDIFDKYFVHSRVKELLFHTKWDEKREVVKMWAYVSDLLPKGGEQ